MDKTSITIATLVDRYLSACRSESLSPKTIRGYDEKLRRYVRQVGGTLGDFTLDSVRQHLTSLQRAKKWEGHPYIPENGETLSTTTIRNHGMVLTGFSGWLCDEGYTESSVLSGLKLPKANNVSMEPLSDDEIPRLMSCFNLNLEIGCRNAAIIWLFLDTGLRCAELVSLEIEDLFLETRRLKILGKGRKERILLVPVRYHWGWVKLNQFSPAGRWDLSWESSRNHGLIEESIKFCRNWIGILLTTSFSPR